MILSAKIIDVLALVLFFGCWLGYGQVATWLARKRPSLMSSVRLFRKRWIERMCERDNHTADATLLSNLLRGALFLASTTVLILGGLVALLGTAPKVAEVISQLPYTTPTEPRLAEIKALIVIFVFVYAFFKFTWSAWQYNVLSILVGAMPAPDSEGHIRSGYTEAAARVAALAGESYNNGIRAYYFSIPLMAWFIDPLLFIGATLAITIVLYRRDFYSPILVALQDVRT
jgi:uncharacterized membrane protein